MKAKNIAGMEERYAAPCCELLVKLSLPGPRPWSEDLVRWAMANCPAASISVTTKETK